MANDKAVLRLIEKRAMPKLLWKQAHKAARLHWKAELIDNDDISMLPFPCFYTTFTVMHNDTLSGRHFYSGREISYRRLKSMFPMPTLDPARLP